MSDFIKEEFPIGTEQTPEYNQLFNRHLFEKLTSETTKIRAILRDNNEPNDIPSNEIEDNLGENDGILVDLDEKLPIIRLRILTPDNEQRLSVDVTNITKPNSEELLFAQPVTEDTFSKLKALAVDPDTAVLDVKTSLQHAI